MDRKPLNNRNIAMANIRGKSMRSFSLILLVCFLSIVIIFGTFVSLSLSKGVQSLSNRLGADVIVVPEGYKGNIESLLLTGEKSDFYMPENNIDLLKDIEGIDIITPQLYIATLKASCCSFSVQIIGYDDKTDFIIKPWLQKSIGTELKDGEVIIGANVQGNINEDVKFFENKFKIAGKLEKTGMGFDTSVFMNMNTAKNLAKDAERIKKHPVVDNRNLVSSFMIKIKEGYEPKNVAAEITRKHSKDAMYGVYSKNFVSQISGNLRLLSTYINFTIVLIWIVAFIVLSTIFSVIVHERQKEMNIFRVLGATKGKLVRLILTESLIISIFGALIGCILGLVFVALFLPYISGTLNIPYLIPSYLNICLISIACFIMGTIVGPISAIFAGIRISRQDTYTSLKDN